MLAVAEAMFVSLLPSVHLNPLKAGVGVRKKGVRSTRSASAMAVPTVAVSVCPTCAVPVIVGAPVAGVLVPAPVVAVVDVGGRHLVP